MPNEDDKPKRDYRQEVTNQIIEMLEKGTAPWQKPWEPGDLQLPFNPTTEKAYRGGNALHLMAVAARKSFDHPRWLTYKQAHEQGWQVKQGEKGSQIEFWQFQDPNKNESEKTEATKYDGPLRRVFTVFNARQIEGIPAHQPPKRPEWQIAETGESILQNSGARLTHDQHDRAFYSRSQDAIHLPEKAAFKSAADYYGTALHELAHWSGHPSRLNRETLNESYRFGDPSYAKEELRAELTSVFLAAERGIPHNPEQHAAYVGSWIQTLRNDKNEIFRAAKDAHKAADFLLDLDKSKSTELRRETSEHVAAYERNSGTVNLTEKETATERRNPVTKSGPAKVEAEKILDGQVAELTKQLLGPNARLFPAQTDTGRYRGEIIAETEHHILQKLSPQSAAAHPKQLLPGNIAVGQNVIVAYANQTAHLQPNQPKAREHSLGR